jgi:hypothetical protein
MVRLNPLIDSHHWCGKGKEYCGCGGKICVLYVNCARTESGLHYVSTMCLLNSVYEQPKQKKKEKIRKGHNL